MKKLITLIILGCFCFAVPVQAKNLKVKKKYTTSDPSGKYKDKKVKNKTGHYNHNKKEFSFTADESPMIQCWRLVHADGKVIALFESSGLTTTVQELFCSTKDECDAEILRLELDTEKIDNDE